MRREYLWYAIAACWAVAALVGLLRHHAQQALPAALFAMLFALIGVWVGKRDEALRLRRGGQTANRPR